MRTKLSKAREYLDILEAYSSKYKQEKNEMLIDAMVLNYSRFHSCLEAILIEKANDNEIECDSMSEMISELGRYDEIVKVYKESDELMYDYTNSEYYDTLVLNHLSNEDNILKYREILTKIENWRY